MEWNTMGRLTFQRFALGKVSVLIVREDARPVTPYDTLKETIVNLFTKIYEQVETQMKERSIH